MRSVLLTGLLIMSTAFCVFAQADDQKNTDPATPAALPQTRDYVRPSGKTRFKWYVGSMFGPVALSKNVAVAGIETWKNSPEEFNKSRDYFHRAVEEDPSYALGYCGLNSFYGYGAAWGIMPPDEGWPKAEWQLRRPSNSMTSSLKHTSIWLHSRWFTT